MDIYPITHKGQNIGKATVCQKGLYYHIHCVCTKSDCIIRITVTGECGTVDLGICVPMHESMGLSTMIPVKKLGVITSFEQSDNGRRYKQWIPLTEGQSVGTLSVIRYTRIVERNGQTGLEIK